MCLLCSGPGLEHRVGRLIWMRVKSAVVSRVDESTHPVSSAGWLSSGAGLDWSWLGAVRQGESVGWAQDLYGW
jgi:hypothetical protein